MCRSLNSSRAADAPGVHQSHCNTPLTKPRMHVQLHGLPRTMLRSQQPLASCPGRCHAAASILPTRASRSTRLRCIAEKKEYYDYKDMPPLPLTVSRIHIPKLGYTVVDKSCEETRMASLAIFYDIYKDDQYMARLTRKSAITALCMYDRDDVTEAERAPGTFPNIDLLQRVYSQGMELDFVVEEFKPQ